MWHFLRKDYKLTLQLILGIFALWSAVTPWMAAGLFSLFDAGGAALLAGYAPVGVGYFIDAFVSMAAHLWGAAFFLTIIGFGIGRQLINQTARHSLIAPLATLAARLGQWLQRALINPPSLPAAASLGNQSPRCCLPTLRVRPPPVALLAGAAPLLE